MNNISHSLPLNLAAIVDCHIRCFPESFSGKLGKAYSIKSFAWFLARGNRFLFHAVADGKVVGYCGGFCPTRQGEGSTSGMLQFAMREAVKGVLRKPWLLLHKELRPAYPLLARNVLQKIFGDKRPTTQVQVAESRPKKAGLVVIGVLPEYRGTGVFHLLMQEFERQATLRGISNLYLSVRKINLRAIHAYQKEGWRIFKEHETSYEMQKILIADG